jgi:hypothetical protein
MSVFNSVVVDEFPKLVRGGGSRNSEERNEITELLNDGLKHRIDGIETDKEFNALQQRIRGVAKQLGISVTVQRSKDEDALYLQRKVVIVETDPETVTV